MGHLPTRGAARGQPWLAPRTLHAAVAGLRCAVCPPPPAGCRWCRSWRARGTPGTSRWPSRCRGARTRCPATSMAAAAAHAGGRHAATLASLVWCPPACIGKEYGSTALVKNNPGPPPPAQVDFPTMRQFSLNNPNKKRRVRRVETDTAGVTRIHPPNRMHPPNRHATPSFPHPHRSMEPITAFPPLNQAKNDHLFTSIRLRLGQDPDCIVGW